METLESPRPESTSQAPKPIRRSKTEKVIAGVCGGLGRSLGIDPLWLRIAFVALTLASGSGVLLYIVAWIAIPEEKEPPEVDASNRRIAPALVVGTILIALGTIALFDAIIPWSSRIFWPLVLVAIGAAILMGGVSRDRGN